MAIQMKFTQIMLTGAIVLISLGILVYVAGKSISDRAILPFGEYVASSTHAFTQTMSSSTEALGRIASTTLENNVTGQDRTLPSAAAPYSVLHAPSADFRILIASTSAVRQQGLSGRISMASDEGLLFIFPEAGEYGFWMKDMNFPIDIVWIDADRKVVGISENVAPESYPENFYPPKTILYVLELNAGAVKKAGLKVGSVVGF